ncbi:MULTISPECIES: TRAP transporter permease [Rhodobacterales]|uniref:C4-dicarboxylate ABC transporter permease n=2 Tax=Rhodobacterales TaxID=204455 RepID=A0A074TAQ6_9RHOB|nr:MULTISPECIES: TRAP transporter fused permease subunit [Rhodobacterales]KEP68754.1 C4-dicarboxylate ABC transporter permease [Thioclava dalianensis]MBN9889527.1 TRAP transporter fused permease subunit [Salipiger abyssi]PTQ67754.1 TRAP transporter 4TM/12TM fusion protein [Celeribacter persicus]SFN71930.1 TRAP transporter, 4TM/12TM fusion protein [Thioclava dalianensis]
MTQTTGSRLPTFRRIAVQTQAVALSLLAVAVGFDAPSRLGLSVYVEQILAVALGLGLGLVFLIDRSSVGEKDPRGSDENVPADGGRTIDWILAVLGLGLSLYVAINYADIVSRVMSAPVDIVIMSGMLVLLVLEGLRRVVGWALVVVVLFIGGYGMIGHMIQGAMQTRQVSPDRLLSYIGFDANGMLGLTMNVSVTVVAAFVLFGQILVRAGGGEFFNDIALAALGRRRGGAAKISILASTLFGTISGVVVSNIVATGVVTIRLMIRSGYRPRMAAAVEAVASTGGQIAPPVMGAVAFLMADFLGVSYAQVAIAAIIPAALYYFAVYCQVDLEAAKANIAPLREDEIPSALDTLRRGGIFILPFAVIVVGMFWLGQRPETAALWAAGVALICGVAYGYGGRRITLRMIWQSLAEAGISMTEILMIAAAAGFIIGVLNITGLGFAGTFALAEIGRGSLPLLLLLTAIASVVLGMGMPTVAVYLLLAVLLTPPLVEAGITPMAAHFFIFYLGMMSMVTPPVGIGAFFAAALAGAPPMQTAFVAMRLGWTAYIIPFIFVVSPALLMQGTPVEIFLATSAAAIGVYAISAAMVGWFGGMLSGYERAALGFGGVLLLMPEALGGGYTLMLHGLGVAIMVALRFLRRAIVPT